MIRFFTSFIFLLCFTGLWAQDAGVATKAGVLLDKSATSIQANLREIGFVHERHLGTSSYTVQLHAGIRYMPLTAGSNLGLMSNRLSTRMYLSAEPRLYYNLAKRVEKGKTTDNFSGNFLGMRVRYDGPYTRRNENAFYRADGRLTVTPRWGLRRRLGEHFDFEFAAGLQTSVRDIQGAPGLELSVRPAIDWKFGFRF